MSGEITSSPQIECNTEGAFIGTEVVSGLIAANTTKPFESDETLQIVFRDRSPDATTGVFSSPPNRIDLFRSARFGEPQDEATCNFVAAHELKHFIDDHEGSLAKEKLLYYARKESETLLTLALGAGASMLAMKSKLPRKQIAGVMLGTSVIAGLQIRKRLNESFFAPYEDRKAAYDALPWEKRANDFAEQHMNDGLVRF